MLRKMNLLEHYELSVCETIHEIFHELDLEQLKMLAMGLKELMDSYREYDSPVFNAAYTAMQLCILEHNARLY